MKNFYLLILLLLVTIGYSQSHGISYQAVLLKPKGEELPGQNNSYSPLLDKNVCLRFEIRNSNNQLEYQETITTKTDSFGMVNLIIGNGDQTGGIADGFNAIVWNAIPKKLIVALDTEGKCNTFIEISNQDFTGVPFAFSAQNATNISGIVPITNGGTSATNALDARINLGLGNVNNTSDANKPISTATQTALDLKEDKANKSTDIMADGNSVIKYPSVKLIKDYVDSLTSSSRGALADMSTIEGTGTTASPFKVKDIGITTAKLSDAAVTTTKIANSNVTYSKIQNVSATDKVLGRVSAGSGVVEEIATTGSGDVVRSNSPTFTGTVSGIDKTMVGLGNVDDTTDLNKPISTATQLALDLKESIANKSTDIDADANSTTKYPSVKIIKDYIDSQSSTGSIADATTISKGKIQLAGDLTGTASAPLIANNAITNAKIANGIDASKVGLGNVDNTSDINKPISTATQTALNLKQDALINPVTGTGTTNFLSKFTGTGTIGVSQIFDDGTNLGIGTNSPPSRLSINSSTSSHMLSLESSSTDGTILTMKNNSIGGGSWRLYSSGMLNSEGAGHLLFNNVNGTVLLISERGNVLIGTTSYSPYKLDVNGSGRFTGPLYLNSWISNGDTFNSLPSVNGTLAVTSQIDTVQSTLTSQINNKQNALSGSGLIKSTSGTISYLTDNSNKWDEAYNDKIKTAEVTGTSTKTLTLTQQDGGTVTASWPSLTIGNSTGLVIIGDKLLLGASTATTTGALTSADWNRFNNKQNSLSNPVTGTGTVNNLPKFTGSSTLGDSNISDDGTIVAIATNATINGNLLLGSTNDSGAKLQVTGAVTVDGTIANKISNDEGTDTTIDFSLSNIAYTAATSNVISITNIKDGGTYHLATTATTVYDKVTFTVPAEFTLRDMGTTNRINGNMHLYRFVVAGTNVFVTMASGN